MFLVFCAYRKLPDFVKFSSIDISLYNRVNLLLYKYSYLKTFYANLARLPAPTITMVLDVCFSGVSPKGMLLKNVSPVFVRVGKPLVKVKEEGFGEAVIINYK